MWSFVIKDMATWEQTKGTTTKRKKEQRQRRVKHEPLFFVSGGKLDRSLTSASRGLTSAARGLTRAAGHTYSSWPVEQRYRGIVRLTGLLVYGPCPRVDGMAG